MGTKTNILGWAAVVGAIGLLGYAGYRGIQSILPSSSSGGDSYSLDWLTASSEASSSALDTSDGTQAAAETANAVFELGEYLSAEDDPEVKAALEDYNTEYMEYLSVYSDWKNGLFPALDFKYYDVQDEWQDVLEAGQNLQIVSDGKYVFEVVS